MTYKKTEKKGELASNSEFFFLDLHESSVGGSTTSDLSKCWAPLSPPQTRNQQKDAQNSLAAGRLGGVVVVTPVISIDIISMNSWFCQRFGWNDDLQLANNVGTV